MFRYLPEQASELAPEVDWIHHWITDLSIFFTVAICGSMLYFAIKYRKRDGVDHETPRIEGNNLLEIIWTVVPTIISVIIAYYGVVIYQDMVEVKKGGDVVVINARGRQWAWDFQYDNGKSITNEFVVPVGRPTRVVLTSTDVLHGFFIPSMRVKKDVVPGAYTHVSFTPVKEGTYNTFCTEYCGREHSYMLAKLRVVSEAEYQRWVNDRSDELIKKSMSPAKLGGKLYYEKGCNACHSLNGSKIVGPSFLKLYGKEREFKDGSKVEADENYIKTSILYPQQQIVKGYELVAMPSYKGQLTDEEIGGLIAYIRTLDGSQPVEEEKEEEATDAADQLAAMKPVERGEWIYQNKLCITCHSLDGSKLIGPSFKGLWMKEGEMQDGSKYVADAEYIKNSILYPTKEIVKGYQGVMPSYQGQLNDDDINGVIEYLKTLKE